MTLRKYIDSYLILEIFRKSNFWIFLTNNIIIDKLFTRDDSTIVGLGWKMFWSLLELIVTNAFFIFNSGFYQQIGG